MIRLVVRALFIVFATMLGVVIFAVVADRWIFTEPTTRYGQDFADLASIVRIGSLSGFVAGIFAVSLICGGSFRQRCRNTLEAALLSLLLIGIAVAILVGR